MTPQACRVFLVPTLLDALLPSAILNPTATFVLWCLYFLCSLKFLGSVELFKPAWGHEDKAQLWLWDWGASWPRCRGSVAGPLGEANLNFCNKY